MSLLQREKSDSNPDVFAATGFWRFINEDRCCGSERLERWKKPRPSSPATSLKLGKSQIHPFRVDYFMLIRPCVALSILLGIGGALLRAEDAYENYVETSQDFRAVKQDKEWALKAYPSWLYMPWTYQWGIGYDESSGKWTRRQGYNGAFVDHGDVSIGKLPTGRLDWIEKHKLPFYVDHLAGKGILHLWDGDKVKPHLDQLHGTGVRINPLNASARSKLEETVRRNIAAVKKSPMRAAYALDDEPSWGHFVHPTMWQVTDDPNAYPKWLAEVYGQAVYGQDNVPKRDVWISYEDVRKKLPEWSIAEFDASPLMDQWSFNDSQWCNLLGDLVEYTNGLDPETPCGLVGGQMPSPFGGYDYAKLMKKVQFIESYNLGSSQSIIRSFNPRNALPAVTTHFHQSVDDTIWQTWYYAAHGNRGHIGWVEKWFDGKSPASWHQEVAISLLELGTKIGPLMQGAESIHDGVAIYYSHASIQLGWILDAECHGRTWTNRNNDERLSSSAQGRKAWENMLRDSGIQYDFVHYADVIQHGVPDEYRVLILPACLCLSEAEARRIEAFCRRGGTVIADFLPGLWDQHGKGRSKGGVLDHLFGIQQDSQMKAKDIFGDRLWVEVDQDANYSYTTYDEFLTNQNTCLKDDCGFYKAVRTMPVETVAQVGKGKAVLMNLSPQWYNAYRVQGSEASMKRRVFIKHVESAGVKPRMRIVDAGEKEHGYEVTYWKLPQDRNLKDRNLLFLCLNPEISGTSLGGGNSVGLKSATLLIKLRLNQSVSGVRNERTGQALGSDEEFELSWKQNEAIVLSYDVE